MVGALKGNTSNTPFSVPIQRELWAAMMLEIWMDVCVERFSLPNTASVCVYVHVRVCTRVHMYMCMRAFVCVRVCNIRECAYK